MATIRRTTRIDGVLANVTSVVLCDPDGLYGVRRADTGAVVVAADTPMVPVSDGVYEYEMDDTPGVPYEAWIKRVYAGHVKYSELLWTASPLATPASDDPRAEMAAIDWEVRLAEYGQTVRVYRGSADVTGIECRAIVSYHDARVVQEPRTTQPAITVTLTNSALTGISGDEWTNQYEIALPIRPNGSVKRRRATRMLAACRYGAWITWEVG